MSSTFDFGLAGCGIQEKVASVTRRYLGAQLLRGQVLEKRLLKLKELGTFGISLIGGDAPYS